MTKKVSQERMNRLRQEPDYKALVAALKRQSPDRVEAFTEDVMDAERKTEDSTHD